MWGLDLILWTVAAGHLDSTWRGHRWHHTLECGRSWGRGWRRVLIPSKVLGYNMLSNREQLHTKFSEDELLYTLNTVRAALNLQILYHFSPKYGQLKSWRGESWGPGSSCQPGRTGSAGDLAEVAPLMAGNDLCRRHECQLAKLIRDRAMFWSNDQDDIRRDGHREYKS